MINAGQLLLQDFFTFTGVCEQIAYYIQHCDP